MSETLETEFRPIWLRRKTHRWHWYESYHMTETPRPELAQIWLRRPKKFCSCILILHTWDCVRIKNNDEIFWAMKFFSLISVSFGSFCRTHIRHPPIWSFYYTFYCIFNLVTAVHRVRLFKNGWRRSVCFYWRFWSSVWYKIKINFKRFSERHSIGIFTTSE